MPLDLSTFQQAARPEREPETNPNVKWLVGGYSIASAQMAVDDQGEFVMLLLDGDGEEDIPYALRPGDNPGLAFAEELYRQVAQGLIVIRPLAKRS